MTSRERYRRAIDHKEPDRVPIDAGQDLHNGIHEVAYRNLLKELKETDEIKIYDFMQHLAVVKESVLDRLHVDTRYIFANGPSGFELKYDKDNSWVDEWGIRRKPCGYYDEAVAHPLADVTLEKVKRYAMPNPADPSRFAGLREKALKLHRETDFALIGGSPATLFYLTSELVGFQEYMEKILTDPGVIDLLVEKMLDYWLVFFDHYLDAIGDYIEVVWMGDDWGTQMGPIMNPQLFRSMFLDRYKILTASIKKKKKHLKIALHSCGSVRWAIDDFIDAGIDILHPLQGDALELKDPDLLKKEYGGRLAFYSNLCNQSVLPHGTPAEVEVDVKRKIKALAPGGGYIVSAGHNIQADVPAKNILALYDTAVAFGKYPIGI